FARLQVVFVAVPRADEMNFGIGKRLADPGAVGADYVLDLVHDQPFASRAALVHAEIFIGVESTLPVKHADLAPRVRDDAALAIGKLRGLGNKYFRHARFLPAANYDTERRGAATPRIWRRDAGCDR